jgi:DNA-binding NarL/FixJ family response regulator
MNPINILIVDDHPFIIDGIRFQLSKDPDMVVIGEANNGKEALNHPMLNKADIVIMDLEMPVMNAFATLPLMLQKHPECKVLIITSYDEKLLVNKSMQLGAKGFALKNISGTELVSAIKKIMSGQNYISDELMLNFIKKKSFPNLSKYEALPSTTLTNREKEILALIANGFSNTEIASQLFLSVKTVDTHRTNLMKKINAKNIAELVRFAIQLGYI